MDGPACDPNEFVSLATLRRSPEYVTSGVKSEKRGAKVAEMVEQDVAKLSRSPSEPHEIVG